MVAILFYFLVRRRSDQHHSPEHRATARTVMPSALSFPTKLFTASPKGLQRNHLIGRDLSRNWSVRTVGIAVSCWGEKVNDRVDSRRRLPIMGRPCANGIRSWDDAPLFGCQRWDALFRGQR